MRMRVHSSVRDGEVEKWGDGWLTADVDDANDEQWVRRGNDILGLPGGVHWLGEEQTQRCAAVWDPNNDMGVSVLDTFTLSGDGQQA